MTFREKCHRQTMGWQLTAAALCLNVCRRSGKMSQPKFIRTVTSPRCVGRERRAGDQSGFRPSLPRAGKVGRRRRRLQAVKLGAPADDARPPAFPSTCTHRELFPRRTRLCSAAPLQISTLRGLDNPPPPAAPWHRPQTSELRENNLPPFLRLT